MRTAVYCATRNIYADMLPAVKSLLRNSNVEQVYFLIEDDEFPYFLPEEVKCSNVSHQHFFPEDGPNYKNGWTYMVLMRAALHRIFPDLDTILSLDVDTICAKDVSPIWDTPLGDNYLAGAREPIKSEHGMYINAGVMLMNLRKLREDGMGDRIIAALNAKRYTFNEQDCINELCRGKIAQIQSQYNSSAWTDSCVSPKLVHFAAIRHYQDAALWNQYREMSWEDALINRRKQVKL